MSSFWIFLIACGIIFSIAQKNQAKQRRRGLSDEPDGDNAQNDRAEFERQIREAFGEMPSQDGNQAPLRPKTPTYTQAHSTSEVIKPKKSAQKSAKIKAAAPKVAAPKAQPQQHQSATEPENKSIEAIVEDFSMEKAVIYSEIIRPKWEEF